MNNFRLSPLVEGKPIYKKRFISWLWLFIAIETFAAGCWIFRLENKIHQLEQQIAGENHV